MERFHAKVHPPRLLGKSVGLYATRSPHRPNEIGLSLLKIDRVVENKIFVSGLDIIDQTPVIDLKPYLPKVEAVPNASAGWVDEVKDPLVKVEFSELASKQILSLKRDHPNLVELIRESLAQDPRPMVYKENLKPHYREVHIFQLGTIDVEFCFQTPTCVTVINVITRPKP